jgi:hypothetical protein
MKFMHSNGALKCNITVDVIVFNLKMKSYLHGEHPLNLKSDKKMKSYFVTGEGIASINRG